ncbi:MAG: ribonuclease HI [Bacteriovoracaceae bacterium]|nr:ribonuclease HI [Bacteriovoracaceae bacterium]
MSKIKQVTIFCDGSSLGNPGPGGYGAILIYKGHERELSGGFRLTTNNRMEIMAAIFSLESLKESCSVVINTDSNLLVNTMMLGWAKGWRARNWKKKKGGMAKNTDLLAKLLDLCDKHDVVFNWVKAHAGQVQNERCDQLAKEAASQSNLPVDIGYEDSLNESDE